MKSFSELIETLKEAECKIKTITSTDSTIHIPGCTCCGTSESYKENPYAFQIEPLNLKQLNLLAKTLFLNKTVLRVDANLFLNFISENAYQEKYEDLKGKMTLSEFKFKEKNGEMHLLIMKKLWSDNASSLSQESHIPFSIIKMCLIRNDKIYDLDSQNQDLKEAKKSKTNLLKECFGLKSEISSIEESMREIQEAINFYNGHISQVIDQWQIEDSIEVSIDFEEDGSQFSTVLNNNISFVETKPTPALNQNNHNLVALKM